LRLSEKPKAMQDVGLFLQGKNARQSFAACGRQNKIKIRFFEDMCPQKTYLSPQTCEQSQCGAADCYLSQKCLHF